jgi:hypothetical protein
MNARQVAVLSLLAGSLLLDLSGYAGTPAKTIAFSSTTMLLQECPFPQMHNPPSVLMVPTVTKQRMQNELPKPPGLASDPLGVHVVALTVAMRDRPLSHVGHDRYVAKFPDLLAAPDRVGVVLQGNPHLPLISEAFVDSGRVGPEPARSMTSLPG